MRGRPKHFAAIWTALDGALEQPLDFRSRLVALTALVFEHNTVHRSFLRLYRIHPPTVAEPYQSRITLMQAQERSRRAIVDTLKMGQRERLLVSDDVEFLGSMLLRHGAEGCDRVPGEPPPPAGSGSPGGALPFRRGIPREAGWCAASSTSGTPGRPALSATSPGLVA